MNLQTISPVIAIETSVAIVRMKLEEAEQTNSLFRKVVRALPYYNSRAKKSEQTKYTVSQLKKLISSDPESVLIAKREKNIIGFCFSRVDDEMIWLSWIGVHPNYRQQGLGTALLSALDERAKKLKSHKIWCDSRTNNEASKLILSHFGYRQLCAVRDHWYRQDFFLWEKPID
jgi:ribosomal protein S18 acetylase RimI-like enzyme